MLRPGNAVAADGTLGLLCRLLPLLRAAFPRARFLVRLDGGFATPEIFDFLDAEPRLDYVVAMAKNAVLQRHAESAMQVARAQSEVGGETAHVYTDTRYAARTWDHERRVVTKAEGIRLAGDSSTNAGINSRNGLGTLEVPNGNGAVSCIGSIGASPLRVTIPAWVGRS